MPVDGVTREYTWEDILCLILRDMGLDPQDRRHHNLEYCGGFQPPTTVKDQCIRVTKYEQDSSERLEEHVRDKL